MKIPHVALAAFLFTAIFFAEYIPPLRTVHIPYDLEGFHYPLADFIFQNLAQSHFPQWDPTIYGGMSLTGNIQAALFYPPLWLLYGVSFGTDHLSYQALQDLVFAHVWLAFVLCYVWLLRGRLLLPAAAALGAGVFAFSGYMCTQLQHFGLAAGYAWFPLGLWGIDQAVERQSWRPLWKVAAASALCFLAGYPPTWAVFVVCAGSYGLLASLGAGRPRIAAGVGGALAASLALVMVQLLPTWEAAGLVEPDARYGGGVDLGYLLTSWLLPNFYNFSLSQPVNTNLGKDYFYLGPAVVAGLLCLLGRRPATRLWPVLGMGAVCLVMVTNPLNLVWSVLASSTLAASLFRDWYFLAGVTLSAAGLAACGLDAFLRREPSRLERLLGPFPLAIAALAAAGVWAGVQWFRWSGSGFPSGWASAADAVAALAVFSLLLSALRTTSGEPAASSLSPRMRTLLLVALLLSAGLDYKVLGTSKRFNAGSGSGPHPTVSIPADLGVQTYQQMRAHPEYRVLLYGSLLLPGSLRSVGLTTPQGFDPLLTTQLRQVVSGSGRFDSDRTFTLDPADAAALQLFGVRYVVARRGSPEAARLDREINLQPLPPEQSPEGRLPVERVFEYRDAIPVFGWEAAQPTSALQVTRWRAEDRVFQVRSSSGGKLTLAEQFYPGWSGEMDGRPVQPLRWQGAFQALEVPPGEHTVRFHYRSSWIFWGGGISLLALLGLLVWARAARQQRAAQD